MRSIGKKNIKLVRKLTQDYIKKHQDNLKTRDEVVEWVFGKLSTNVFNSWEGAHDEIINIIDEVIMEDAF